MVRRGLYSATRVEGAEGIKPGRLVLLVDCSTKPAAVAATVRKMYPSKGLLLWQTMAARDSIKSSIEG